MDLDFYLNHDTYIINRNYIELIESEFKKYLQIRKLPQCNTCQILILKESNSNSDINFVDVNNIWIDIRSSIFPIDMKTVYNVIRYIKYNFYANFQIKIFLIILYENCIECRLFYKDNDQFISKQVNDFSYNELDYKLDKLD
jgi:hypothetical protein